MSCLLFCRICDKLFKCSAFKHHQNQELQYAFTKGLKELSLPSTNETREFFWNLHIDPQQLLCCHWLTFRKAYFHHRTALCLPLLRLLQKLSHSTSH